MSDRRQIPFAHMVAAVAGSVAFPSVTYAQAVAQVPSPVTVTPQTLAPQADKSGLRIDIPEAGVLTPPAGADGLTVQLSDVSTEGLFPEVREPTQAIVAALRNRRVTVKDIYAAASAIEAAHARAGFVLVRVSVPPQDLRDGAPLRIVITDGFVESIDVSGLPRRVRAPVLARVVSLQGRRHLRLADIEQPLLIANDVPGLMLRSTLLRGTQPGGTRLVLEGSAPLVSGSIGLDNQFDRTLDTWGVNAQLSLNSALGQGEQIYGFASSGYDLSRLFDRAPPVRVYGGGVLVPALQGRLTINPEATFSRTRPTPGAGAPAALGTFRRLTLRGNYTALRTRARQIGVMLTVEQIEETNRIPDFAVTIGHDRYLAARLGVSYARFHTDGTVFGLSAQVSQGLGDLGAISTADMLASGAGYSRQGASNRFTKIAVQAQARWPLNKAIDLSANVRGQSSFGQPLFRAEQIALEGPDGLSAYVGGVTAVDEGAVARVEIATHARIGTGNMALAIRPYAFAAGAIGRLDRPTLLEPDRIALGNLGAGLRLSLGATGISLAVEYAHGFADDAPLDKVDRVNVTAAIRF